MALQYTTWKKIEAGRYEGRTNGNASKYEVVKEKYGWHLHRFSHSRIDGQWIEEFRSKESVKSLDHGKAYADNLARLANRPIINSKCQWFALCENDATRAELHPTLGAVPICNSCSDKLRRIEKGLRK